MQKVALMWVVAGILLGPSIAQAAFLTNLTSTATNLGNGSELFHYTVDNLPTSDKNILAFSLNIAATADLHDIVGPTGWSTTYNSGDAAILWQSDPTDPSIDIQPGASTTFSFESHLAPVAQPYELSGIDVAGLDLTVSTGTVLSAAGDPLSSGANVPLPPAIFPALFLIAGLAIAAFLSVRHRRLPSGL